MIDVFHMPMLSHNTIKKQKIISSITNIKPILKLYNWGSKAYTTTNNKNNYTSFKKNPEIALILLYLHADVKILQLEGKELAKVSKSIEHTYVFVYLNNIWKEKKKLFCYQFPMIYQSNKNYPK